MKKIDFAIFRGLNTSGGGKVPEVPYLDLAKQEEPLKFLFTLNGKGMIAEDNIHTITGGEKTGKSAVGIALMAAALRGEFLGIKAAEKETPILWVDTEQDTRTLRERALAMLKLAGYESGAPEALNIVTLRAAVLGDRLSIISQAIRDKGPKLVFIDGAVDLCEDFNDNTKSLHVVEELLRLSEVYHCTILTVIHTNRQGLEARGHLGAFLQQKSGEVYHLEKILDIATVKQALSRFAPVPPFSFRFGDNFTLEAAQEAEDTSIRDIFLEVFENDYEKQIRSGKLNELLQEKLSCARKTASATVAAALNCLVLDRIKISGREVYYQLNQNAGRDFGPACTHEEDEDDCL